jgi:putative hydrolase of the HAD superfamily
MIKTVFFDFGKVISKPPSEENWNKLLELSGISEDIFTDRYTAVRGSYDRGTMKKEDFWSYIVNGQPNGISKSLVGALAAADNRCWSDVDQDVLDWAESIRSAGFKTGILSNMPDAYAVHIKETMPWFYDFSYHVLSCELQSIKPEREIYEAAVNACGDDPPEILFFDDTEENVEAAKEVGITAYHYRGLDELGGKVVKTYGLPPVPR